MTTHDLIFDVGCNNGDDAHFYLQKGFRVVAIDADISLCNSVSTRFSAEIAAGRCHVIHGAVGKTTGEAITFYICDAKPDWNTCDAYFVARNENEESGIKYRSVEVKTINISDLMDEYGTPYYIKIDIEGADKIPLENMIVRKYVPDYTSIEISLHDFDEGLDQIRLLTKLGYKRFNFFNQGMRRSVKAPNPPREGNYVEFDGSAVTTGLFGKELDGAWLNAPAAEKRFAGIHRRHMLFKENRFYSKNGGFGGTIISKIHNRFRRHVLHDPVAWYDLHARK